MKMVHYLARYTVHKATPTGHNPDPLVCHGEHRYLCAAVEAADQLRKWNEHNELQFVVIDNFTDQAVYETQPTVTAEVIESDRDGWTTHGTPLVIVRAGASEYGVTVDAVYSLACPLDRSAAVRAVDEWRDR
jgi:hypothetical protein